MSDNPYNNPLKFGINQKNNKRKPVVIKNPRMFITIASSAALLIFFSKPIYDIFFNTEKFDIEQLKREHSSKFR